MDGVRRQAQPVGSHRGSAHPPPPILRAVCSPAGRGPGQAEAQTQEELMTWAKLSASLTWFLTCEVGLRMVLTTKCYREEHK